jgi:phospholipase/lecithinase/hemolysin
LRYRFTQPIVRRLLSPLLALCLVTPALAGSYSQIIAFGDSLSDTGNLYKLTFFLPNGGIPAAPYYEGRFSDGLLPVEYMGIDLNTPVTSYAFAGAQTGEGNQVPQLSGTGLTAQVRKFANSQGASGADPSALYFLWAGPNDFYSDNNIQVSAAAVTAAKNMAGAVQILFDAGARDFFVPLMPDLSDTPAALVSDPSYRDAALKSTQLYNALLKGFIQQLSLDTPGLNATIFDTPSFIDQTLPDLIAQGFNATDACYNTITNSVCSDADKHLFWDDVHPSTATDYLLGQAFAARAVPEPATVWLQGLGLGIVVWATRRRRARSA